jgi:broad specificity phosphatase PhoE
VLPDDRKRYLGHSDPPLGAAGLEQAHGLAERLRPVRFSAAYSSDLQRSLRTAEIIVAGTGLPVQTNVHLREIDAGTWEGLSSEEVKERFPKEYEERERDLIGFRFPGGESYRDLSAEVVPVFQQMLSTAAGDILIVAHKGVNRILLGYCLGLPLEEIFSIPQDYGCVNILRVATSADGGRRIDVVSP